MLFVITTTANARRDIQQAIDWENGRQTNLGARFLNNLHIKLERLSQTPYIGSVRYENVRCTIIPVFQYMIHYTVNETAGVVTVLRVLHVKRKPIV